MNPRILRANFVSVAFFAALLLLPQCKDREQSQTADTKEGVIANKTDSALSSVQERSDSQPAEDRAYTEPEVAPVSPVRVSSAKALLERHLRNYALISSENTWALIHALLVFPPHTRLKDQEIILIDAILSMATTVEVEGKIVPTFTGLAQDGTPREPHQNQVVKVLLGMGISLDHPFTADGREFTVSDLVDSALWRFEPPHENKWEHESWTLSALARSERHRENAGFTNYKGERFEALDLIRAAADHLNREMEFIEEAQKASKPINKTREGVHAHPCGGLHLARTPTHWMKHNEEVKEKLMTAMRRASFTLSWRVTAEHDVYERIRAEHPSHEIMISAQEMKFYGHWLETMADLRDAGIEIDRDIIEKGIALLVQSVERLDRIGTFQRMEDVKTRRVQTYRDLIGDSAHALRGLRLWTEDQ